MIGGRRPLQGRKPGDRRVRVERPHAALFRWTGPGQLTAKEAASAPATAAAACGRREVAPAGPAAGSEEEIGERLSKKKALAIFSSDAISSSAYATEEILRVLILGGAAALAFGLEISIAIAVLLIAVAISYRQICIAYPTGGGSYSVSKRNFGRTSLIAASALLIDYVMTVAVSTSSAVEQITSAVPALIDERVIIGVVAIALITLGNLRGLREAGNIFAIPTYLFLGSALLLMIAIGTFRIVVLGEHGRLQPGPREPVGETLQPLSVILLLRAFAAGAVALTGTEAIATGVPAFQPPEAKNAATTLAVMAGLLGVLFIGITFLAVNFGITHIDLPEKQTVISQVARRGLRRRLDPVLPLPGVHGAPALPRREHQLQRLPAAARDPGRTTASCPRQFAFRGDRLAFSYGIVVLATVAASLIVIFGGETHLLIPLYAVGVFIDFTISQTGMIRHWLRERPPGWRRRLAINAFGCRPDRDRGGRRDGRQVLRTSLIVLVLIPVLVALMPFIHRQYGAQRRRSSTSATTSCSPGRTASSGSSSRSTASTGRSSRP